MLRGGGGESNDVAPLDLVIRWLQGTGQDEGAFDPTVATEEAAPPAGSEPPWLIVVTVGGFLCYAYCMIVMIRQCRRENVSSQVFIERDGVVVINPAQRRAVLEVIFSENSKAVEKKEQLKGSGDEGAMEKDMEANTIPESITLDTLIESGVEEDEADVVDTNTSAEERTCSPDNDTLSVSTPDIVNAANTPLPPSPECHRIVPRSPILDSPSGGDGGESTSTTELVSSPKSLGGQQDTLDVPSLSDDGHLGLSLPEGCEEYRNEERGARMLPLPPSIALNSTANEESTVLASNFDVRDDDSTDGNVCAICISGYEEGEMIIASKHCTHAFHKECLLEWLEKHDVCPCCRVPMVTESDISEAADAVRRLASNTKRRARKKDYFY